MAQTQAKVRDKHGGSRQCACWGWVVLRPGRGGRGPISGLLELELLAGCQGGRRGSLPSSPASHILGLGGALCRVVTTLHRGCWARAPSFLHPRGIWAGSCGRRGHDVSAQRFSGAVVRRRGALPSLWGSGRTTWAPLRVWPLWLVVPCTGGSREQGSCWRPWALGRRRGGVPCPPHLGVLQPNLTP